MYICVHFRYLYHALVYIYTYEFVMYIYIRRWERGTVLHCGAALCTCEKRVASVRLSLQSYKCYIVVLLSALARNVLMYCGTVLRACEKRLRCYECYKKFMCTYAVYKRYEI